MTRPDLIALISDSFREVAGPEIPADNVNEGTRIFGRNGAFDSMRLLTFVIEVEQRINDRCGTAISIADDRAVSQERSPFRTIGDLANYITTLLAEQSQSC